MELVCYYSVTPYSIFSINCSYRYFVSGHLIITDLVFHSTCLYLYVCHINYLSLLLDHPKEAGCLFLCHL